MRSVIWENYSYNNIKYRSETGKLGVERPISKLWQFKKEAIKTYICMIVEGANRKISKQKYYRENLHSDIMC